LRNLDFPTGLGAPAATIARQRPFKATPVVVQA
jgi:hypothetical protein